MLRNLLATRPPLLTRVKDDHPLALFHHCDQEVTKQLNLLNQTILQNPDDLGRRNQLMLRLKESQNNLMDVIGMIAKDNCPDARARRDFRMKYPDDVMLHQLNGPLWFGAECLAAGSYIAHREEESEELRPYAAHITELIHQIRLALRKQVLAGQYDLPQSLKDLLSWFDHSWAEFEFRYVSIMCPVMSTEEFDQLQDVTVLFIEATKRAMKMNYITEDMMDMMDPALMFAIPRLAIVWGLVLHPGGPLDVKKCAKDYPYCFRPYRTALEMMKKKLDLLSDKEMETLESALCTSEGFGSVIKETKESMPSLEGTSPNFATITDNPVQCNPLDINQVPMEGPILTGVDGVECAQVDKQAVSEKSTSQETGKGQTEKLNTSSQDSTTESREHELQRLFVGICGIADKMQSKFSKEMRMVLKHVFYACQGEDESLESSSTSNDEETSTSQQQSVYRAPVQAPPSWVRDNQRSQCHCCLERFSFFKRKHHCRNCGEVVCNKCSPYTLPLPKFGIQSPVRVCSTCYIAHVNRLLHPEAATAQ